MEYKELAMLFHMDKSSERAAHLKAALDERLNSDSAFRIDYKANGDRLFFTTPRELSLLAGQVLSAERNVTLLMAAIPGVARDAILRGLVLDEVVSSNEIEGVHSTKREVKDALNLAETGTRKNKRFKEFATLYMGIVAKTAQPPQALEDIRAVYDDIMYEELSDKDRPDGKLFRASSVSVSDGIRSVHNGLEPEKKIDEAMEAMLNVAQSNKVPALYGAIVSHYLFEYAHPFYDGNGRTGRYLLALYLSKPLSEATSLSLSRTIAEHKNAYYKAFSIAENPLNHGELTHYVYQMLKLVSTAQNDMLKRLGEAERTYEELNRVLGGVVQRHYLKERERDIVFQLMQSDEFGFLNDLPLSTIANYLNLSEQMARKYVAELEKKGIVRRARKRAPLTFALTDGFEQEYKAAMRET